MTSPGDHRALGLRSLWPAGIVLVLYQGVFGTALYLLLGDDPLDAVLCAAPVVVVAALVMTSQADRKQYIARLLAAVLFLPIGLLFWAIDRPASGWSLLLLALAHAAGFVLAIMALARFVTRIDAVRGVPPISVDRLAARMASLQQSAGGLFRVDRHAGELAWTVALLADAQSGRAHRMTLRLDPGGPWIEVEEFLAATGAAPRTDQERSLRAAGEPWFDPTRPEAHAVWNRTRQSSMIDPDRLATTRVRFDGDEVRFDLPQGAAPDNDAVITLFAAVVTRSGYGWAPRLF